MPAPAALDGRPEVGGQRLEDQRVIDGCRPAADVDEVGLAGDAREDELAAGHRARGIHDGGHDGRQDVAAGVGQLDLEAAGVAGGRRRHHVELAGGAGLEAEPVVVGRAHDQPGHRRWAVTWPRPVAVAGVLSG